MHVAKSCFMLGVVQPFARALTSMFCLDRAHARKLQHVWMMCDTVAITDWGHDAALKIFSIGERGACRQRKCRLRASSLCWFSVPLRGVLKLLSMLDLDQPVSTLSLDFGVSGNLSSLSGPRVTELVLGPNATVTGSKEPMLGPEVSLRGGGSHGGSSPSGLSGTEAIAGGSRPMGTGASFR